MARPLRLLILQVLLIFLVSNVSTYELPDFSQVNQDVALFLTPYGIFKNFTNPDSQLRSFYFEKSAGQTQLNDLKIGLLMFVFLIILLNFRWIFRGLKDR